MTDTADITVYGTSWCRDCVRSKALLDAEGVAYRWVDIEQSKAAADEALAISGRTSVPVIVFPDGSHVVEPSDETLKAKLAVV
jgi:glutaredoxin-like protein